MNKRELTKLLKNNGFYKSDLGKGSHEVWIHEKESQLRVTVPQPTRSDYDRGTLNAILKQAGLK